MKKEKIIKILAIACFFAAGFFFVLSFNDEDSGDSFEIVSASESAQATSEGTASDDAGAAGEGDATTQATSTEAQTTSDGLININTADEEELKTLPGIGTVRAQAIIKYRETNGNFANKTDIMKVSGIKEASYEKIKDLIKVE